MKKESQQIQKWKKVESHPNCIRLSLEGATVNFSLPFFQISNLWMKPGKRYPQNIAH